METIVLPSDTDVLGDMAVPGMSDDPTEAVTGVATQMEITGTSGSSASDTVELLEVKKTVQYRHFHMCQSLCHWGTANGAGCYVTNMRSGWDDCGCWWNLPAHWEAKKANEEK